MNHPFTILVVDDTPANIGLLLDALSGEHRVLVAESAVSCFEQLPHARPDLILLDVRMPGMDGFEVCRRLKGSGQWKTVPVIFMTALDEPEEKARALELGAVDYVTKPVHIPEVLARVKTHLSILALTRQLSARQRELETEVEMRRELEFQLQHSLEMAVLCSDREGNILFLTRRARSLLLRYFPGPLNGQLPASFLEQSRTCLAEGKASWEVLRSERPGGLEVRLFHNRERSGQLLYQLEEWGEAAMDRLRPLGLSPRETEVLFWITEGKTYPEIGTILEVSVRTVHKHAENLLRKLKVESRSAAMRMALEAMREESSG